MIALSIGLHNFGEGPAVGTAFAQGEAALGAFLGIALGAIWQVIVEVTALLRRSAARDNTALVSWINLSGFVLGLTIKYLTAFLVKF